MLEKAKRGFKLFMSFLWISFLASLCNVDYESARGLELNGYVCFLLWIVFIYLMVKVSMVLANVGFLAVYIFLRFFKFGYDEKFILGLCCAAILISLVYRMKKKWR